MDTKWKKSKSIIGFLAFLLGVSLLLEGALFFGTAMTSSNSRAWVYDSFKSDWRRTREFKNFVSNRLERLITMGAGGWAYGYYSYSGDDGNGPVPSTGAERWAKGIHEKMKEDKNVLYTVAKEGEALYSNSDTLTASTTAAQLPEGYGFLLQFDGEKVRAWLDGEELNIYGSGYYHFDEREDSYQWYVPGYKNFTVDEAGSKVKVTMAVISSPQIFIKGNYGSTGSDQYNTLYYIKQGLEQYRERIIQETVRTGVGAGVFLVYLLLRKDKKRADMALARGTGKVWFEVKILAALLLVFFCLPRTEYLGDLWQELTYAYAPQASAGTAAFIDINGDIIAEWEAQGLPPEEIEAALSEYGYGQIAYAEQASDFATAVTVLRENGGWLLREYLWELADHTPSLLAVFWGLYLLIVNDWRYNRKPWKQGILGMLAVHELKYPLQKRLSRMSGWLGLAMFLLWLELLFFLVAQTVELYIPGNLEPVRPALAAGTGGVRLVLLAAAEDMDRLRSGGRTAGSPSGGRTGRGIDLTGEQRPASDGRRPESHPAGPAPGGGGAHPQRADEGGAGDQRVPRPEDPADLHPQLHRTAGPGAPGASRQRVRADYGGKGPAAEGHGSGRV